MAALDRHVACAWVQQVGPGTAPLVHRIVPDGCVDIVWLSGRLHVAGPDTGPVLAALHPGSRVVGIRFRPGLAPTMLGVPTAALIDDRVDLDLLWGHAAERLTERLSEAGGPGAAMAVLERELVERLPASIPVDPLAEAVVAELRRGPPAPVVAKLAATLGTSERQPPTPATPTRRTWLASAAVSAASLPGGCSPDRRPAVAPTVWNRTSPVRRLPPGWSGP